MRMEDLWCWVLPFDRRPLRLHIPELVRCWICGASCSWFITVDRFRGFNLHEDDSPDLREVGRILKENLQMPDVPLKARRLVARVCDVVARRAARLAAAGVVGTLKKVGRDGSGGVASGRTKGRPRRTVVAIEGGLYANYSMFKEYLNEAVAEILGEEVAQNVILRTSLLDRSHQSQMIQQKLDGKLATR